jgi:hypothetical protein
MLAVTALSAAWFDRSRAPLSALRVACTAPREPASNAGELSAQTAGLGVVASSEKWRLNAQQLSENGCCNQGHS